MKSKILRHGVSGVLSFFIALACFSFFNIPAPFSELLFVAAFAGLVFFIETSFRVWDKPSAVVAGIFAAALSLTVVVGNKIRYWGAPYYGPYSAIDILYGAAIALALFFILLDLLHFVQTHAVTRAGSFPKAKFSFWLIVFGVLVICWLPYYLVYYPGNLSPDSSDSLAQALGKTAYSNHCPILYTLFVKVCVRTGLLFGDLRFGVGAFTLVQMLIMAAILSYSVYWLAKRKLPGYAVILTGLFYALNPVIAMYAVTVWKDILFSGWMLLLTLAVFDVLKSEGKLLAKPRGLLRLSLCCLLAAFGRNNGIYAVVAVLAALGLHYRKQWKVLAPVFAAVVVFVAAVQGPVYNALGVRKSEFAESVGIPLQQIGLTVKSGGRMTAAQEEFLGRLLPVEKIARVYDAETPDSIKFDPDFNGQFLENNKGEFLKVWAEMLLPNFKYYVEAYLMQTIGYWHVETTNWVCQFGIQENQFGLQTVRHDWMQAKVRQTVESIYSVPLVRDLFDIAFMVWTAFFACAVLLLKKQTRFIIAFAPLLALWATMMIAAPTYCEFRYMYSFHLILPFLLLSLFVIRKKESRRSGENGVRDEKMPELRREEKPGT